LQKVKGATSTRLLALFDHLVHGFGSSHGDVLHESADDGTPKARTAQMGYNPEWFAAEAGTAGTNKRYNRKADVLEGTTVSQW